MPTVLNLTFKTSDAKLAIIRINAPRADVTRAEAEVVMQEVIAQDVFETGSGARLIEIDSISTVTTTKSELLV